MNWFMIIRIKHESESEKYKYCWHRFFFLQRYAFLLKDARNFGKMFESEGDNKKSKEKRLFCCHYQNIYVLLQKQKPRGHHQHRIIWERALPGLRCKDKNKNGIYQRFFRKSSLIPVIAWLWHDIALYWGNFAPLPGRK